MRIATVDVPEGGPRGGGLAVDGVMAPMPGAGGYREAGYATGSLVDGDGEREHSVPMGRMPQTYKATLKMMVTAAVEAVPGYSRGNRRSLGHADAKSKGPIIGSGVVEAAGKTLITEPLERSGMRWGVRGGHAVLTPRPFVQNRRFDHAGPPLTKAYRTTVARPDNVVSLRRANIPWD